MQIYAFEKTQFPLEDINLANPQGLQGGAFFSKLKLLGENITLQTPSCKTKSGIVKTEKKIYCDIMFDKDNDNVIDFLESIEDKIKNLIYEKKDKWFHSDMDMDTIDYHWQNILRSYKGKKVLLRCFIKKPKSMLNSQQTIQIYDEDENLIKLDDLTKDKSIMALLEVSGLKFTSQSFSLEFNLTQVMVLKEKVFRNKCLIKTQSSSKQVNEQTKSDKVFATLTMQELKSNNESDVENTSIESADIEDKDNDNSEDEGDDDANDATDENDVKDAADENDVNYVNDANIQRVEDCSGASLDQLSNNLENGKDSKKTMNTTVKSLESLAKSDEYIKENKVPEVKEESKTLVNTEPLEKNIELNEINLVMPEDKDTVQLKKPNEVYMEIYKEVKRRAKTAKKRAIEAYLEAKRIKSLYLLDEIESSDDESELLEMNGKY